MTLFLFHFRLLNIKIEFKRTKKRNSQRLWAASKITKWPLHHWNTVIREANKPAALQWSYDWSCIPMGERKRLERATAATSCLLISILHHRIFHLRQASVFRFFWQHSRLLAEIVCHKSGYLLVFYSYRALVIHFLSGIWHYSNNGRAIDTDYELIKIKLSVMINETDKR